MNDTYHAARIRISPAILIKHLNLPCECKFMRARITHKRGDLEIVVEHPDLPEIIPGGPIPLVTPKYTVSFDWNLKGYKDLNVGIKRSHIH